MISYFDKNFTSTYFFPSDDIAASDKGKEWHLALLRAIYSEHNLGKAALKQTDILKFNLLRQYMIGRQSADKYKESILGEEIQQGANMVRKAYTAIDYDNLITPIPKYINKVVGMIMDNGFDILVSATDERTEFSKSREKTKMAVKMKIPEFFQVKKQLGLEEENKGNELEPKSLTELEIIQQMGYYKLPYEVAFEKKIIPHTLEVSNEKVIEERKIRDLLSINRCCTWDRLDKNKKIQVEEYVDPEYLIIQDMGDGNYAKASYGAVIELKTIADLRNELQADGVVVTEEKLMGIARNYAGKFINPGGNFNIYTGYDTDTSTWKYDSFVVPVMYGAKKCMDNYYDIRPKSVLIEGNVKHSELRSGKIKEKDGKYYKDIEIKEKNYSKAVIRHGYWVVGTDLTYGFGIMENSFDECELPFHCYRLPGKSMVELMIPTADTIAVNALKLQNDSANAAPNGLNIELGALEEMSIGGKKYAPFEIIAIASQTGNMLWRQRGLVGNTYNQQPSITKREGGMGQILNERMEIFAHCYNEFAQVSGLLDNYKPSQTATEINASVATTNDVLKPIINASIQVRKSALTSICNKVQMMLSVTKKQDTGYDGVISDLDYKAIKEAGKLPMVKYSISIQEKPSNAMKQVTLDAMRAALQSGRNGVPLIKASEFLFLTEQLDSGYGVKYIRQFMMLREAQREQQDQEQSANNVQQQSAAIQEQIATKQQGEKILQKDKLDLELRNKLEEIAAEHNTTLQQMASDYGFQDASMLMQQQIGGQPAGQAQQVQQPPV